MFTAVTLATGWTASGSHSAQGAPAPLAGRHLGGQCRIRVRRSHGKGAGGRALGAALLASALCFVALKYLGTINHWKLTHWLFDYELGFVKRGVVGTLVGAVSPEGVVRVEWIVTLSLGVAALFLGSLAALAWPAFARPERRRALACGLCALASPGFGFLLSDLGRFDVLNYALVLIALVVARARRRFPYPVFLAVAALALLIHEAALLLAVPVLFVGHLAASDRLDELVTPRRWPALAALAAPVWLLFALIVVFGGVDLPLRDLVARLGARADFPPVPQSAYVLLRSIDSGFAQVMGWQRFVEGPGGLGLPLAPVRSGGFWKLLAVALAQLALAQLCLRALAPERRRPVLAALHLCFLAPFALLLVGIDWGRWAALAASHCATLLLFFAPELPDEREAPFAAPTALLVAVFVIVSAGAGYEMEGAREGSADSPWAGVQRWSRDARGSHSWDRAFVTP